MDLRLAFSLILSQSSRFVFAWMAALTILTCLMNWMMSTSSFSLSRLFKKRVSFGYFLMQHLQHRAGQNRIILILTIPEKDRLMFFIRSMSPIFARLLLAKLETA